MNITYRWFKWSAMAWLVIGRAKQAETVHLINKPRIIARSDKPSASFKFVECLHPYAVILFPKCFVG